MIMITQPMRHLSGLLLFSALLLCNTPAPVRADHIRDLQEQAQTAGKSEVAHWGIDPDNYNQWGTHSNRLIPVYTFGTRNSSDGVSLSKYTGENSAYRNEAGVKAIFGSLPYDTVNPSAVYLDQTDIAKLQQDAVNAGRKHIFLVVFDGMDWQTTRNASIQKLQKVAYDSGRGTGLHFQDYTAGDTTEFSYMVTSPHNDGTKVDVDKQTVKNPGGTKPGGYDPARAGDFPWSVPPIAEYIIGGPKEAEFPHAYTDSASSAASMTAGIKTYNDAINVDPSGGLVETVGQLAQEEGYLVGVVTSVPISHATPACAYAHNVTRDDYQDLTRDLLGLKSISHPNRPLAGVDVLIGAGYGENRDKDANQGENFVPGNAYLTADDQSAIDVKNGGPYLVVTRAAGVNGRQSLLAGAEQSVADGKRFFGFFGVKKGHLPYATADGKYDPPIGRSNKAESYTEADLTENPTLTDMTRAALTSLNRDNKPFWLMVESGDVDWANHDNNIDNSIGAVHSGDAAIKEITDWVEKNSNWQESILIVTADHGHYLVLTKPEGLLTP